MSRYGYTSGLDLHAKRYRAPASLPAFKYRVGPKKVTELYRGLHDAWRAGAIRDFYYGTRSETDSTLVWLVDGVEVEQACVTELTTLRLQGGGIASIEIGAPWCGYPSMTVRYADGSVLVDRYDGCARVGSLTGGPEKRVGSKDLFPELDGLATF